MTTIRRDSAEVVARLARELKAGERVAIGDGAGAPLGLASALPEAARAVGGLSLLLGWCFDPPVDLPDQGFRDVRALMGGYGLRTPIRSGLIRYATVAFGAVPALVRGPLRPDSLVAGLVPVKDGLSFATEVAWQLAAVEAGARVLAEVNTALPRAATTPPLPPEQVVVVNEVHRPPIARQAPAPDEVTTEIARHAAAHVPAGAALQVAPGVVGEAVLAALEQPVRLHSGVASDGVATLDERGLLLEGSVAAYVVGSEHVYRWADGQRVAAPLEVTHDPARLGAHGAFCAVNTAFEIAENGDVNAQGLGDDVMGGVGGLPDFAAAATRSPRGVSVIALPSSQRGRNTLVENLSAPVSLPRYDVEFVVTERGVADLRGLSDAERRDALRTLWYSARL